MEAKHTPAPWIKIGGDPFSREVVITTADREQNSMAPICEMDVDFTGQLGIEQPANAAFIVRACNAYESLIAALLDLEREAAISLDMRPELRRAIANTHAAIAQVEAA